MSDKVLWIMGKTSNQETETWMLLQILQDQCSRIVGQRT